MNDNQEELKKTLDEWATHVTLSTHQKLAKTCFHMILKSNIAVNDFTLWLLLITGATFTLIISNLSDIVNILPEFIIRSVIFILILSFIGGFISRSLSLYIQIFIQVRESSNEEILEIIQEHISQEDQMKEISGNVTTLPNMEITLPKLIKEISEPFPRFIKVKLLKEFIEYKSDPLSDYKRNIRILLWMWFCVISQALLFLLSVFIVALYI